MLTSSIRSLVEAIPAPPVQSRRVELASMARKKHAKAAPPRRESEARPSPRETLGICLRCAGLIWQHPLRAGEAGGRTQDAAGDVAGLVKLIDEKGLAQHRTDEQPRHCSGKNPFRRRKRRLGRRPP